MTRWPLAASSLGRPKSTSPRPPVLENGATSADTKTIVWGAEIGVDVVVGDAAAATGEEEEDRAPLLPAASLLAVRGRETAATGARATEAAATTGDERATDVADEQRAAIEVMAG